MKTFVSKPAEAQRNWVLIDGKGQVLGRLASHVANVLRGKNKPTYAPNVDTGDFVIVINAHEIVLTGAKSTDKFHQWHTGYPGGFREITYGKLRDTTPDLMLWLAVKRMLPRNKLRKRFLHKLKIYAGAEHPHQAQQPKAIELRTRGGR